MPIPVMCAECGAKLTAPDAAAGKKVKCRKCQAMIVIPEASGVEEVEELPAVEEAPKKPKRKPVEADDVIPFPPKQPKRAVEAEDDEVDDTPRKSKKSGLLLLAGLGGLLTVGALGAAVWFVALRKEPVAPQVAVEPPAPQSNPENPPVKTPNPVKPVPPVVATAGWTKHDNNGFTVYLKDSLGAPKENLGPAYWDIFAGGKDAYISAGVSKHPDATYVKISADADAYLDTMAKQFAVLKMSVLKSERSKLNDQPGIEFKWEITDGPTKGTVGYRRHYLAHGATYRFDVSGKSWEVADELARVFFTNITLKPLVAPSVVPYLKEEEAAIALVKKLGGTFERHKSVPGQPVYTVRLKGCKVAGSGLKDLAALKSMNGLDLSGTDITDEDMKEVAMIRDLGGVDLSQTKIGDAGVRELAALQRINGIILGGTKVTDLGLKHLASLKFLRLVDLEGTAVTDAGIREFSKSTSLKEIKLKRTSVTDEGVAELKKALVDCAIQYDPNPKKEPLRLQVIELLDYTGWAKEKVGTLVRYRHNYVMPSGTQFEIATTHKLLEVNKDKCVVEKQDTVYVDGKPQGGPSGKIEHPKGPVPPNTPPMPKGKADNLETLKIGKVDYKTRWYARDYDLYGVKCRIKEWVSDDVPGLLVKREVTPLSPEDKKVSWTCTIVEIKRP